ncbi:hypothetical protein LLS1_18830 [Leifsonia sp. LS1]|uniref:hypothetical protein n=1 Tax=Leifsonia sp. LS1 TaxID=2828483 RepID=UPI001CFC8CC6|nr:hypothetical protein [Leifsonia sp. LS1]GIT80214.1 hypothetical protein LLS1_18830 [Leifsonia sp. LS1]
MNTPILAEPVDLGKYGLTDLRAPLVATLYTDLDASEGYGPDFYYRKLTPPDPELSAIFVCNEAVGDINDAWYVYCNQQIEYDDAAGAEKHAAALLKAAEQARILNASGRVVEVEDHSTHEVGDVVILTQQTDFTGYSDVRVRKTPADHLEGRGPGFTWGDDPAVDPQWFHHELIGRFTVIASTFGPRVNRFVLEELI